MEQLNLTVENRTEKGKGAARRVRRLGKIPGVLYGLGNANTNLVLETRLIHKLLMEEGGRNKVLNLAGSGVEGRHAIVKDYQVDPVKRNLIHVDLLEIDIKKKIEVTVKLNLVGKPVGAADGGVLNVVARDIIVKCLPNQIPKHVDVDVSALKIGDSLHADAIVLPEGIELASSAETTLVTLVPPAKEEEAVASLTPAAEPEVITEKKKEGEEGAAAAAGGDKKDEKKK